MNGTKNRVMKQLSVDKNNRRHLAYGGEVERPKAIWGAIIGAAASIASSLLSSHSQHDALRRQQIEQRNQAYNEQQQEIVNLANNALTSQENLKYKPELVYKNGGKVNRRSIRTPMIITDGGEVKRLGHNTFLLRGGLHEDINDSGNTGIGINYKGNQVEAEGGEVVQEKDGVLRIFSNQPILGGGVSPAKRVLKGDNKDRVFNTQERTKYRLGISTPVEKFKPGGQLVDWNDFDDYIYQPQALKDYNTTIDSDTIVPYRLRYIPFLNNGNPITLDDVVVTAKKSNPVTPVTGNTNPGDILSKLSSLGNRSGMSIKSSDWIGLGTDLIGSIGSGLLQSGGLKGLTAKYVLPTHVDETPVSLDTTYHNEAQLAAVERNRLDNRELISGNTASSVNALGRIQQADTNALLQENQLWNEKENKEVELRNQNKLNEQQVRGRNAQSMNEHLARVAQIKNAEVDTNNQLALQRLKARQFTLQGIAGAANNFLNQTRQRYEDEQAMRYALAASDNGTAYRMLDMGVDLDQQTLRGLYNNAIRDRGVNPGEWTTIPGETPAAMAARRKKYDTDVNNYKHSSELINAIVPRLSKRSRRKLGLAGAEG